MQYNLWVFLAIPNKKIGGMRFWGENFLVHEKWDFPSDLSGGWGEKEVFIARRQTFRVIPQDLHPTSLPFKMPYNDWGGEWCRPKCGVRFFSVWGLIWKERPARHNNLGRIGKFTFSPMGKD